MMNGPDVMMIAEVFTAMRSPLLSLILILLLSSLSAAQSHHSTAPKDKQNAAQAFEEGQNAHERGDLSSAIRHYTNAITADPALFQAYYQRAVALLALNRDNDAIADLRRVVELEPRFARAHRALGKLLLDRGETEEAKRELASAIELEPKITDTRIYYASALMKTGEHAKAAEHLLAGHRSRRSYRAHLRAVGRRNRAYGKDR